MTKDVLLSIRGLQFEVEPEGDKIETITPAEYYLKNDGHYILYDELAEGFTENTRNIIHIKNNELSIVKRGVINAQMLFSQDKKNMTSYMTPFGSIMIGIDTRKVDIAETEDSIKVHIDYSLELNYEHYADCKIDMNIRSKETGGMLF